MERCDSGSKSPGHETAVHERKFLFRFWAAVRIPVGAAARRRGLGCGGDAAGGGAERLVAHQSRRGRLQHRDQLDARHGADRHRLLFFGFSNTTALSFSANTTIGGWTFNAGASAYSFTNGQTLNFTGAGIAVNGGSASITNNFVLQFSNASTAGNATITNNNVLQFLASSTAGSAVITNNGGLSFNNTSTGGNAAITNNSGGVVDFSPSTGPNNDGKLSAGSIAGAASYYLGARPLTVGRNNPSTTVSGVISDCGPTGTQCAAAGATGGPLGQIGPGTPTPNGAHTHTGRTNAT